MAYFPFFVELSGKRGLVVGGGMVALRKVEKLLPYGPALTVAAPELLPELGALPGVELLRRPFSPELLEGMYFAIAAAGDAGVNRTVAALCRERGILVNVVDDRDGCTFLFPALVKDGPLSVGVSTGGASPSAAAWVRGRLEDALPQGFGDMLSWLEAVRPAVKEGVPEPGRRGEAFARLFALCLERDGPPGAGELAAVLAEFSREEGLPRQTVEKI